MPSLLRSVVPARRETRDIATVDDYIDAVNAWGFSMGGLQTSMGALTGTYGAQQAETVAHTLEGFTQAAYAANGVVFACMATRLAVFSTIRFQWQQLRSGTPSKMFGTPALDPLEVPWAGGTTQDLLTRMIQDADLAGNSYWAAVGGELVRLRPDWVQIVLEPRLVAGRQVGWRRLGYAYWEGGVGNADPAVFLPEDVAHFAPTPDPLASYRGMSWLTPVLREITNDKQMLRHKSKFFENAATPNLSVALDKDVRREAFDKFRQAMQENHRGVDNAYKCLHPDTDVAMWDGRRVPARDVAAGDLVVAWAAGEAVPGTVAAAEWQPPSPIVTVRTQRGREIRTNDRHPFLVGGKWIDAADLAPGDLLTTGLGWADDDAPSEITEHEAWLLGALTGDGSLVSTTPVISAWDDGVRSRVGEQHELRSTGKGHDYRVLGVTKLTRLAGLTGKRSWEKRIPEQVMTGPARIRAAFLSGLIDTDGHVADPARRRSMELGITSVSRELLVDAQHLLASLGVNSSVSCSMPASRGDRDRDAWRLCAFGNSQARRLSELLDLACASKAERLTKYAATTSMNRRDSSRVDRVVSVEISGPEPTIGIEVAEHHTHVTGGVVTHNTLYLGGGADVKVIGADFRQMDFKSVQGHGETRIAAAAGVPPIIVGLSEGLASATYSNYGQARRRFADGTMHPLWQNAAGSLAPLIASPGRDTRLWYDSRDVPFLREDRKDAAEIQQAHALTIRTLVDAGYHPDAVIAAVTSEDFGLLQGNHSGLFSVMLQPPGTTAPDASPDTTKTTPTEASDA